MVKVLYKHDLGGYIKFFILKLVLIYPPITSFPPFIWSIKFDTETIQR